MTFFSDWIHWVFPLGIALTILWDGRRKPTTIHMAVFWTVAEIHGAIDFQAGFHWRAIIGVAAVTVACLPGLLRLLTASAPRRRRSDSSADCGGGDSVALSDVFRAQERRLATRSELSIDRP